MLTSPPLSFRETERRAQELFHELLKTNFTGTPHQSPIGDVTFDACDFFYNQADITAPDARPQIHLVWPAPPRKVEWWFASGTCADWIRVAAAPASGVRYGVTSDGHVEEQINGKLARRLPGSDYRLAAAGDDLLEQTLTGSGWTTVRTIPGADGIQWLREGDLYTESSTHGSDVPATLRVISFSETWSGPAKLVVCDVTANFYVRAPFQGEREQGKDFLCRRVADHLKELFESEDTIADLGSKGIRHCVITPPVALNSSSYAVRLLVLTCKWRYTVPRQQG